VNEHPHTAYRAELISQVPQYLATVYREQDAQPKVSAFDMEQNLAGCFPKGQTGVCAHAVVGLADEYTHAVGSQNPPRSSDGG